MVLKDLIGKEMQKRHKKQSDIARQLGVTKQVISATLNRDLEKCRLGTLREYFQAVGLKWRPLKLVR